MNDIIGPQISERFRHILDDIELRQQIVVNKKVDYILEATEQDLQLQLDIIRDFIDFQIPDSFKYCIPVQNEVELVWTLKGQEDYTVGEFYLGDLMTILSIPAPELAHPNMSTELQRVLSESKIIDDQKTNGNGRLALLRIVESGPQHEIWYFRQGELYRMMLDYPDYLYRLSETRGVYDWQFFFCDTASLFNSRFAYIGEDILPRMKEILELLVATFDDDYTGYKDRYDQLRGTAQQ